MNNAYDAEQRLKWTVNFILAVCLMYIISQNVNFSVSHDMNTKAWKGVQQERLTAITIVRLPLKERYQGTGAPPI